MSGTASDPVHLLRSLRPALVLAASLAVSGTAAPALAASCLEQIVEVQAQLKAKDPHRKQPPSEPQSVGAQLSHDPTPQGLAAAGLSEPTSGAEGALNQAINLQAGGDESGCLAALAQARTLGGLK